MNVTVPPTGADDYGELLAHRLIVEGALLHALSIVPDPDLCSDQQDERRRDAVLLRERDACRVRIAHLGTLARLHGVIVDLSIVPQS